MTQAEFRNRVLAYQRVDVSTPYANDEELDGVILPRLENFTRISKCLYSPKIVFALSAGVGEYPCDEPSPTFKVGGVDVALESPLNVFVDGRVLYDHRGYPGPASPSEQAAYDPGYSEDQNGKPVRWYRHQPGTIVLHPVPDQAYPARVEGFYVHPRLTAGHADGVVSIPSRLVEDAALYCWAGIAAPHATGRWYERLQMEEAKVLDRMKRHAMRSVPMHTPSVRGIHRGNVVELGGP